MVNFCVEGKCSLFSHLLCYSSRSGDSETVKEEEEEGANLISEAQEEQEDSADYIPGGRLSISLLPC